MSVRKDHIHYKLLLYVTLTFYKHMDSLLKCLIAASSTMIFYKYINFTVKAFANHKLWLEKTNKAIEEICGKSTWNDSFSSLAAVTGIWSKKQKTRF